MKKILSKKGFTLIELMVVMAIIAVLAVLIIGAIQIARKTATETTHRSNGETIHVAIEAIYARTQKYPDLDGTFDAVVATGQPLAGTKINSTTCDGGGSVVSSEATATFTITVKDSDCGTMSTITP